MIYRIKVYRNGIVKLPAVVRRKLGIKENDELICILDAGRLILIPGGKFDPIEECSSTLGKPVDEERLIEEGEKELSRKLSSTGFE